MITSASNRNKEVFTLASWHTQYGARFNQGSMHAAPLTLSQVVGMHRTCTHLGLDIVEGIKEEERVLERLLGN